METDDKDALRQRALDVLHGGAWPVGSAAEKEARTLLPELRKQRQFELLAQLSERLLRDHPEEALIRRLHVQALIETGYATAAVEVARAGVGKLWESDPEWSELHGLIGRAYKQIAVDARDPGGRMGINALRASVAAYARPYETNPANTWHAINLVAVLGFCQRLQLRVPGGFDMTDLARQVVASIGAKPADQQDLWDAATLAEAHLALKDYDAVERNLGVYLSDPRVSAFDVGSTLRQWSEVWGLKDSEDDRARGFLQALRTRLMELPGAQLRLAPSQITAQIAQRAPSSEQLQAILGKDGTMSYEWWKKGLERAVSVCAIYAGIGQRIGTGFLVSATDFGYPDDSASLVLTNYHVVNPEGGGGALRPADAELAFEAVDSKVRYEIAGIVWSSPQNRHDASLLRLNTPAVGVFPVPMAKNLPVPVGDSKVYIIGHPGGGDLEFSFQDNALLDHEGILGAKPLTEGVCRLHYRTPTEKGSSGSPVFNAKKWEGVALHHAGGELSRLNGQSGTYSANEGISLQSMVAAMRSTPRP